MIKIPNGKAKAIIHLLETANISFEDVKGIAEGTIATNRGLSESKKMAAQSIKVAADREYAESFQAIQAKHASATSAYNQGMAEAAELKKSADLTARYLKKV